MTLLDDWKSKTSWKHTYPMVPVYQSLTSGKRDMDLRKLLENEKSLTLDIDFTLSGISEIAVTPAEANYNRLNDDIKIGDTLEDICQDLINILTDYLDKCWNSSIPHIVFTSGGRDSRIIALCLRNLSHERDLGEFKFICHEPEHDIFCHAMKEMGWDESQYEVFNKEGMGKPDYYNYGDIHFNMNGFVPPSIMFYDYSDLKKKCLVSGNFGDNFFNYPSQPNLQRNYGLCKANFGQMAYFSHYPNPRLLTDYYNWEDILYPYADYDYMRYAFKVPKQYFKIIGPDEESDLMRCTMLKILGNNSPVYVGHNYNFINSKTRKMKFNDEFKNSRFFKWFAPQFPYVEKFEPGTYLHDVMKISTKCFGLATVFEGLKNPIFEV